MNLIADIEWHAKRAKEDVTGINESRIDLSVDGVWPRLNLTLPSCSLGPLGFGIHWRCRLLRFRRFSSLINMSLGNGSIQFLSIFTALFHRSLKT